MQFLLQKQKTENSVSADILNGFQICKKSSAIDHLKGYWTKTLLVVNRLETELEVSFKKDHTTQPDLYFMKIKSVLNCYQLLIVEFNEYCEVLQIQGLGKCMLKIFIQVISIIQSILKKFLSLENNGRYGSNNFNEELEAKERKIERNNEQKKLTYRSYFVEKQKNKYEVKQIEQELNQVQEKYQQDIHFLDDQKTMQARKKAINLQPSNAQFIIKQAFIQIESKQNSLLNIMELRNQRIQIDQIGNFRKGAQLMFDQMENSKIQCSANAVSKLLKIVEKYLLTKQLQKKQKMVETQTQTDLKYSVQLQNEKAQKQRLKKSEQTKNLEIKSLKQEIKELKFKNQSLELNLKKKAQSFEKQLVKNRIKMRKLEQRASIAGNLEKSQFELDLMPSEKTVQKDEKSQINISNMSNATKNSIVDKDSIIISKKRNLSRRSNFSHARPSYDDFKKSFNANTSCQPRCSYFFENVAENLQSNQRLSEDKILQASGKTVNTNLNTTEQVNIVHLDASSQTQARQFKQKQSRQKQKAVKFRGQLKIKEQYSWYIGCYIIDPNFKKRHEIVFNNQQPSSTLLRKKRATINWPQRVPRGLNQINEQEQENNLTVRCKENELEKLFIGNPSDNSEQFSKLSIKEDYDEKIQPKMKIPASNLFNFSQEDIDNLFLKVEKAMDYEFLNYNIKPYVGKYESVEVLKSQKCLKMKRADNRKETYLKNRAQSCNLNSKASKTGQERLIQFFNRYLKMVKSCNDQRYEKLRNFLRYPHSAIFRSTQQKWKDYSQDQEEIGIHQLRKIFSRFGKIHSRCQKKAGVGICQHLLTFFQKIGLSFVPL